MKDKLMAVLGKVKELLGKAYAASPFLVGMVAGYFGKPLIQLAVNCALKLAHLLVG